METSSSLPGNQLRKFNSRSHSLCCCNSLKRIFLWNNYLFRQRQRIIFTQPKIGLELLRFRRLLFWATNVLSFQVDSRIKVILWRDGARIVWYALYLLDKSVNHVKHTGDLTTGQHFYLAQQQVSHITPTPFAAAPSVFSCCSAIPKKDSKGVRDFFSFFLSMSVKCSTRVFVTSSTFVAAKTWKRIKYIAFRFFLSFYFLSSSLHKMWQVEPCIRNRWHPRFCRFSSPRFLTCSWNRSQLKKDERHGPLSLTTVHFENSKLNFRPMKTHLSNDILSVSM